MVLATFGLPRGITDPPESESEHQESNQRFANLTGDAKDSHIGQKWLKAESLPSCPSESSQNLHDFFSQQLRHSTFS